MGLCLFDVQVRFLLFRKFLALKMVIPPSRYKNIYDIGKLTDIQIDSVINILTESVHKTNVSADFVPAININSVINTIALKPHSKFT